MTDRHCSCSMQCVTSSGLVQKEPPSGFTCLRSESGEMTILEFDRCREKVCTCVQIFRWRMALYDLFDMLLRNIEALYSLCTRCVVRRRLDPVREGVSHHKGRVPPRHHDTVAAIALTHVYLQCGTRTLNVSRLLGFFAGREALRV